MTVHGWAAAKEFGKAEEQSLVVPSSLRYAPVRSVDAVASGDGAGGDALLGAAAQSQVRAALEHLEKNVAPQLDAWDALIGDGDCGRTVVKGARVSFHLGAQLCVVVEWLRVLRWIVLRTWQQPVRPAVARAIHSVRSRHSLRTTIRPLCVLLLFHQAVVSDLARYPADPALLGMAVARSIDAMGGSFGALLCIFFSAAATAITEARGTEDSVVAVEENTSESRHPGCAAIVAFVSSPDVSCLVGLTSSLLHLAQLENKNKTKWHHLCVSFQSPHCC